MSARREKKRRVEERLNYLYWLERWLACEPPRWRIFARRRWKACMPKDPGGVNAWAIKKCILRAKYREGDGYGR